ncbi:divergent polysaccharide deacetylase family protein [Shouchella hunanensis]|uniref:Divergent polysaccharide deacetylase family protein n=1 Tax=Shouchella hunanensis TaxID=766894 RepID=A0ABY7W3W0_9BACI|nr:divergent polysaccharide deacetylase family protein [Shouchella hunanensis]WDF03114.1 divergent polysaccharide deacetylase family protein [Shouchella hunanensis]
MVKSFFSICLMLITAFLISSTPVLASSKQVAIIIDDFGGEVKGVEQFLTGDIPITAAIMPFLDQAQEQDKLASEHGLEVIIHLPLEPKVGKKSWLGPNPITSDLSDDEINHRLNQALERVPHAKGLNNHMGSKGMEDKRIVTLIVQFAKRNGLYLLDSGTTPKSLMPEIANQYLVPCFKRTLFIDDSLSSYSYVKKQLQTFMETTDRHEYPIAIGHVGVKGNETYNALKESKRLFSEANIILVYPSQWIAPQVEKDFKQLHVKKENHYVTTF